MLFVNQISNYDGRTIPGNPRSFRFMKNFQIIILVSVTSLDNSPRKGEEADSMLHMQRLEVFQ